MKRYLVWLIVILSIVAFNGCSSEEDYDDDMISLFLVDKDGYSAGGDVPYRCVDENNNIAGQWLTRPNGEFSFYAGERCTFGFDGYDGTPDEPFFIEDDMGKGKGDIPYRCEQGDEGFTTRAGSFDYLQDDRCTFYF